MPKPVNEIIDPRDDEPFLLDVAARLAFRDGSVSGLVLRRAAQRGELEHEKLGNRIYTTLGWIKDWRATCRQRRAPGSGSNAATSAPKGCGPQTMEAAQRACQRTIDRLLAEQKSKKAGR